ncbi:MAG: four helix bundle protein [Desulfobulbaceae bacterium]|nr:four helix bundle protein [Desulfobulbaceae bacterium]
MELVTEIYGYTKNFPQEEMYGLTSQLRRSTVSIPANIAEGHGRNTTKDYIRFLYIANGSLFEVQTLLDIAQRLHYLSKEQFLKLFEMSREIERMMGSLIRKLSIR